MIRRTLATMACAAAMAAAQVHGTAVPAALGISFIEGSSSTLILERDGAKYLVDVGARSIRPMAASAPAARAAAAAGADQNGAPVFKQNCAVCHGEDGKGKADMKTPNFTDPKVQASLTDELIASTIRKGKKGTLMPAWEGKLSDQQITAVAAYVRSLGGGGAKSQFQPSGPSRPAESAKNTGVYRPGDDVLMSLPTGRPPEPHSGYVNFTHRFAFDPAFSGAARGASLDGLDGVAISSFGLRYGISNKFSVSAYRSPSLIARPIQLMGAYHFMEESNGRPFNAAFRVSVEGQNNFSRNFTDNLEVIVSRSITSHAQLYFVPTVSFNNRRLLLPANFRSSAIPDLPGYNTFSTGVGGAFDIRPTVALVAEVIPTLVNGRPLGIHRPAYAFGIQKKIFRHAFTFGFSNSPGTTVSQRAGTRASYLGDPAADTPGGMFISFDLMRQLH